MCCVGQFVDAGLFVSNVRARVSGCLERQRGAAQFSSRWKGQEGISRAGQEGPGRVRHTAVCRRWDWEPGRSTNSERAQRIVRRCSSVQDWDGDGTGPSNEALLWTRGTSSGIVVVVVLGWLSLCDKRMRLRAARGNPGTQSDEKVGMNHSRCMSGERMEDQKCDPRSGGGRGHTGESCEGGGGFWCES